MKILHIVRDLDSKSGGLTAAVLGMARAQAELGHEVEIAATDYGCDKPPEIRGVKFNLFHSDFDLWRWSKAMRRRLPFLIQEAQIVHIHALWEFPTLLATNLCKRMRKPTILTPHGMLHKTSLMKHRFKKKLYLSLFGKTILKNAKAIHFTSRLERRHSKFFGLRRKSFIAFLGISRSDYEVLPSAEAFGERFPKLKDRRFVLFLGRLHPKKCPEMLIEAFSRIAPEKRNVFLVMAGTGAISYVNRLKKLVSRLQLDKRVIFTGILKGQAVPEAYRAAELFVLPSLQENFGLSIVEAMASGCPVIISDQLDLALYIRNATAGIACHPLVDSLSDAIRRLLNDEELRRHMGENGRTLVFEKFTWNKTIDQLMVNCDKVLKENPDDI